MNNKIPEKNIARDGAVKKVRRLAGLLESYNSDNYVNIGNLMSYLESEDDTDNPMDFMTEVTLDNTVRNTVAVR